MTTNRHLVTGASGFIGTHLLRRLVASGQQCVALDIAPPRERIDGVEYLVGDVRDLSDLSIGKLQSIWNLAAVHTTPGHPDHEYYDTNIFGALEITRLADASGAQEIIFTSSISIYGPSEDQKTERSKPAPVSAYGKSKFAAERIHGGWQQARPNRKLTIVRPAVVFGEGEGGNFARMASLLRAGIFVFPGRRDTVKSCIYVEDLIDLMFAARNSNDGRTLLNGSYPECPTLEKIVTTLQEKYFKSARLIDVPRPVVMGAAQAIGLLKGAGGIHPERVTKLIRSTHVYPEWVAQRNMLPAGSFSLGVDRWADATKMSFI